MNDPDTWTERFPFIDQYFTDSETECFQDAIAGFCHYAQARLTMTHQDIDQPLSIGFDHFLHEQQPRKEHSPCTPSTKTSASSTNP